MRRGALALCWLAAGLVVAVRAQDDREPTLVAVLDTTTREPAALVRVEHMLAGDRFLPLLRSGFPLYLEYRVEIWRNRSRWFDQFVTDIRWQVVITHDPMSDLFVLERDDGWRERLRDDDAVRRALRVLYRVPFTPPDEGRYYVVTVVEAHTLTDSDLDEVARWLRGDLPEAARDEEGVGTALARGARRLLVRAAGLPRLTLSARSAAFTWPQDRER